MTGKKSKAVKFSGFFRKVREGLKEKQCCWCAGKMWGSRKPAACGAQDLVFAALVSAGSHTRSLEISYSLGLGLRVCLVSGGRCKPLGALRFRFKEKGDRFTEKILQIKQKISCFPFW